MDASATNQRYYGSEVATSTHYTHNTVEMAVLALIGGHFVFPEDTEPVSAVYVISVSGPLFSPVQLQLQHCVTLKTQADSDSLTFAMAPVHDHLPHQAFKFDFIEGGVFLPGTNYGTIYRDTFSLYVILKKIKAFLYRALSTYDSYYYQVIYQVEVPGSQWRMIFFACKDLVDCKNYIRDSFKNGTLNVSNTFQFEERDGSIELDIGECRNIKGWSIISHSATKISKRTIDEWHYSLGSIPNIIFTIIFNPSEGAKENLEHKVVLKGIKSDSDYFNIVKTRGEVGYLLGQGLGIQQLPQPGAEKPTEVAHMEILATGIQICGIDSKVASDVLVKNSALIKESFTDLPYLADKMVQREIIRHDRKRSIFSDTHRTPFDKMEELLYDLHIAVTADGDIFSWFIGILNEHGTVPSKAIATRLMKSYDASCRSNSVAS